MSCSPCGFLQPVKATPLSCSEPRQLWRPLPPSSLLWSGPPLGGSPQRTCNSFLPATLAGLPTHCSAPSCITGCQPFNQLALRLQPPSPHAWPKWRLPHA
ncbi:hypothetical protein GOP47_0022233 [Adiantum capillus-veneris]|uniref:Uncharacterized protein n=1 Tax=Adiantum capillus-veneris TaxID=13818 RepID=A0A9D4Z8L6_ADICA|nr:hypothetical protein GOP47_0022233 [Adiantum capillus-veneris]